MDVDNDIDGQLMQQFLAMGTQDREVLVTEFQRLLGNQLNPAACTFFLDMNNWNLQAAIGSYYDYEQQNDPTPVSSMTFIKDITIGEGESVRPGVTFTKTWRIKNTGTSSWAPGCSLKFIMGHQLGSTERVMVENLSPGVESDVSIPMTSPKTSGMYYGQWRMSSPTGALFGDTIWVILQVSETGLLDITQEMSRFGGDLGSNGPKTVDSLGSTYNPFSSPHRNTVHSIDMPVNSHSSLLHSNVDSGGQTVAALSTATSSFTDSTHNTSSNGAAKHISFPPAKEEEDMQ